MLPNLIILLVIVAIGAAVLKVVRVVRERGASGAGPLFGDSQEWKDRLEIWAASRNVTLISHDGVWIAHVGFERAQSDAPHKALQLLKNKVDAQGESSIVERINAYKELR